MVRILITVGLFALLQTVAVTASAADAPSRHQATVGVEAGYLSMSGLPSWVEGSVGKLRYDEDGLVFSRAFLDYRGRWTDTLLAHLVLEGYDDGLGAAVDFTQAYLEWRPVPRSPTRYRVKVGAFYPKISLENVDAGWSSPYTLDSSAINTWVAEELRSFGAEVTISRRPQGLGGEHTFSLSGAVFVGSDPAGSLLAWKGWSVHDRQTRFSDELPLPPLPQIQPGMLFEAQAPYVAPLREVDNDAGFYVSGEWRYGKKLLVRLMHYDNRADPLTIENGQYGWTTKFQHLGVQATLPGDIRLIIQAMTGSTVMGPVMNGAHVVDAEYESQFALLSRAFGRHRVSARYDRFTVTENDNIPLDDNTENGHAWTAAYQLRFNEHFSLAAEWLGIKTRRLSWTYYGFPEQETEHQTKLMLKMRF